LPYTIVNLPKKQFLIFGNVTVSLTSGAGTLTIPEVQSIDQIELSLDKNSATTIYYVKKTAAPTANSVSIEVLTQGVGGTAANPTLDSATSETVYFIAIAH
jgi:hypothetical protein